jgi:hypothetical protein
VTAQKILKNKIFDVSFEKTYDIIEREVSPFPVIQLIQLLTVLQFFF